MPVLEANAAALRGVPSPGEFKSPFPSDDSEKQMAKFDALGGGEKNLAASQARAWQTAVRICMKALVTSREAGGMREQWLEKIIIPAEDSFGNPVWDGLFAEVTFSPSTDESDFLQDMRGVAFNKAIDFLGERTGVWGLILQAAVTIGRLFYALLTSDEEDRLMVVPWREYSRDVDEDLINLPGMVTDMMASVNWTPLFAPALDPDVGFFLAHTDKGKMTRAFGAFRRLSADRGEPEFADGYGFMPGTQQITEVIQLWAAQRDGYKKLGPDAITNIGTFYPSVSQFATAAENFVNRTGSADMYKIQPAWLERKWNAYFDAYFADGFAHLQWLRSQEHHKKETLEGNQRSERLLAKAIWQGIFRTDPQPLPYEHFPAYPPDSPILSENIAAFTTPELFENPGGMGFHPGIRFQKVSDAVISPTLQNLRKRQMACLAHSLACAYVRPRKVGNLEAFAAFRDSGPPDPSLPHYKDSGVKSWGDQLRARCDAMRARFLEHMDRYKTRDADVRAVDPPYADKLKASKRLAPEFPLKTATEFAPLDPEAAPPPESSDPKGGPPGFLVATMADVPWYRARENQIAAGMLLGAGTLGYAGYRAHLAER